MAKETFFITVRALVNGKVSIKKELVEGTRLKNEQGLDLFVHKHKNNYIISEATSGYQLISPQKTKREAVSQLNELLQKKDIEQLKSKIKEATEQCKMVDFK